MALVRDPVTGQMVDDGQPGLGLGVRDTPAAQAARAATQQAATSAAAQRQRGAAVLNETRENFGNARMAPRLALAALPTPTFTSDLPDWRSESQRALDAQPTPREQAGAIRAYDMADRAVRAGLTNPPSVAAAPAAAQPAVPATQTVPTFAPGTIGAGGVSAADEAVIARDRANLQGAVDRLNTNFDTWRVPEPSAQVAQGGGAGLMAADTVPTRGNYTQTNTDMAALQRRSVGGNGINLGPVAGLPEARTGGFNVAGFDTLNRQMMTSDDPFTRRAGREQAVMRSAERVAGEQNATELTRTRLAGELGLQEAGVRGDYALQGADVQGQYGLLDRQMASEAAMYGAAAQAAGTRDAARAKAQGQMAVEQFKQQNDPTNLVQQANLEMARELLRSGAPMEQVNAAANGRLAPNSGRPTLVQGMLGATAVLQPNGSVRQFTPEEVVAIQAGNSIYTQQR